MNSSNLEVDPVGGGVDRSPHTCRGLVCGRARDAGSGQSPSPGFFTRHLGVSGDLGTRVPKPLLTALPEAGLASHSSGCTILSCLRFL